LAICVASSGCKKESAEGESAAAEETRKSSPEDKNAAIAAEKTGDHTKALEHLNAMDPKDPWVMSFKKSVQLMQRFDGQAVQFVNSAQKIYDDTLSMMDQVNKAADSNNLAALQSINMRMQQNNQKLAQVIDKMAVSAKATLPQAAQASADNEYAKQLDKIFAGQRPAIDIYVELGLLYQEAGKVDIKFFRESLEKAKKEQPATEQSAEKK
jgi:hypothetical protein